MKGIFEKLLNLLFKFLKGYVIIKVYGCGAERFINICTRRGIDVRFISHRADGSVVMRMSNRDFKSIRPIAYKTHTKVHIVKKRGIPRLLRLYRRRYAMFITILICILFFAVAPNFVWSVTIEGNERISSEDINASLHDLGIYPGIPKRKLPDGFQIKDYLINKNSGLMWAWAYVRGTNVNVKVSENILPPLVVDRDMPCDIRASCDGYLISVTPLIGDTAAQTGAVIQAGETIVSGKVPVFKEGYLERYRYVHARANVRAYTEKRESGVYKLEYEHRIRTGNAESKPYIEFFGKRLNLFKNEECSYDEYDAEEFRHELFFAAVGAKVYREVYIETEPMSLEGALQQAKDELEEKAAKKLCKNSVLLDRNLQYEYISDNEIKVQLTLSCMEDIGTEVPLDVSEQNDLPAVEKKPGQ